MQPQAQLPQRQTHASYDILRVVVVSVALSAVVHQAAVVVVTMRGTGLEHALDTLAGLRWNLVSEQHERPATLNRRQCRRATAVPVAGRCCDNTNTNTTPETKQHQRSYWFEVNNSVKSNERVNGKCVYSSSEAWKSGQSSTSDSNSPPSPHTCTPYMSLCHTAQQTQGNA